MRLPLLIGYGNTLRTDDGAGIWIVEEFARRFPRRARCLVMHQLGPELTEELAQTPCVVFVDASVAVTGLSVTRIVDRTQSVPGLNSHVMSPEQLLNRCGQLYGRLPRSAYLVHVPVRSLEFGEMLTEETRERCREAVVAIDRLLGDDAGSAQGSTLRDC